MISKILHKVKKILELNPHVVFSYLYGSAANSDTYNDIDIAVYATDYQNPFELSSDLKYELYTNTGIPADTFDIRIINQIPYNGNLFSLLYLKMYLIKG